MSSPESNGQPLALCAAPFRKGECSHRLSFRNILRIGSLFHRALSVATEEPQTQAFSRKVREKANSHCASRAAQQTPPTDVRAPVSQNLPKNASVHKSLRT